jgi:hypothetical protein
VVEWQVWNSKFVGERTDRSCARGGCGVDPLAPPCKKYPKIRSWGASGHKSCTHSAMAVSVPPARDPTMTSRSSGRYKTRRLHSSSS